MAKTPIKPAFRPLRLRGYDYSSAGAYFVTICAQDRKSIFGRIAEKSMILNQAGQLVLDVWNRLPERFSCLNLDSFIIMPNHVHGILIFPGDMAKSEDRLSSVYQQINGGNSGTHPCSKRQTGPHSNVASGLALPQGKACCSLEKSKTSSAAKSDKMSGTCTNPKDVYSLGDVVGAFKSLSTREINKRFNRSGPIWQPNYYEHVIRNERSLNLAREYIMNNPAKWAYDKENPMKK